jgi:hypothetical protein
MPSRIRTEVVTFLEPRFLSRGLLPLSGFGLSPKGTTKSSSFHEVFLWNKLGFPVDARLALNLRWPGVREGRLADVKHASVLKRQTRGGQAMGAPQGLPFPHISRVAQLFANPTQEMIGQH